MYNLEQYVARGKCLPLFLLPSGNTTLGHGRAHSGHIELGQCGTARRSMEACVCKQEETRGNEAGDIRRTKERARWEAMGRGWCQYRGQAAVETKFRGRTWTDTTRTNSGLLRSRYVSSHTRPAHPHPPGPSSPAWLWHILKGQRGAVKHPWGSSI
jgi:hypothetical protein